MSRREDFLQLIASNISQHGYHITVVRASELPRFAYSIGLKEVLGFELILAGCEYYMYRDISKVFEAVTDALKHNKEIIHSRIPTEALGDLRLIEAKSSWCKKMMLGVYDYFDIMECKAFQIVPDGAFSTNEIPKLDLEYDESNQPVWKWLTKEWIYPVPKESTVTTNLAALKGEAITEVMRWEEDSWEMFTIPGTDVFDEDVRVVSLGALLGIDATLLPSLNHKIKEGMWRKNRDSPWNEWK